MSSTLQSAPQPAAATGFQFLTPAAQQDFPHDSKKQDALNKQWNTNLNGFANQAITGNPWNATNSQAFASYVNPIDTPLPSGTQTAAILWNAFPGRISYYFPSLPQQDVYSLADTGYQTNGQSFPNITTDPCSGLSVPPQPYGPYGPRGWQDEYCEWAVTRNDNGQITRIDFTCENPEYWNSLWMIDPNKVVELYRSTLNKSQIKIEDLYLYDSNNQVVIDPSTGRPAYNPLNKWNSGPVSTADRGGAMHLTSTPNTLQTETCLAAAATAQRTSGNTDFNKLICCAQYGQPHRNSDPNIGGSVNQIVGAGNAATLANPPGLYIQMPNFSSYTTPDGANAQDFWTIARGKESLTVDGQVLPGNFILHAVFEVPADKGYTISDIQINGQLIKWAGQVIETIDMHIIADAFSSKAPQAQACVKNISSPSAQAQALQMFHQDIFDAMSQQQVKNPVQVPMTLLSNSTLIAPLVEVGQSSVPMVITAATVVANPSDPSTWPQITLGNPYIQATITSVKTINYAVPGNTYPSEVTALYVNIDTSGTTQTGLESMAIFNLGPGGCEIPFPAVINLVPAGSIHQPKS